MRTVRKLLVTDLDNTLYDWVTFYSRSFAAMLRELSPTLGVSEQQLHAEFRVVHQRYANSEQPFAVLELPSVIRRFPGASRAVIARELDVALHAFNETRRRELRLYDTVRETLAALQAEGVVIVALTDAVRVNAFHRLSILEVVQYFTRLYVRRWLASAHPSPARQAEWRPPRDYVRQLPARLRKPDPRVLLHVCTREGFSPRDTWYVGDSIDRDVAMAQAAGVTAVWAKYGTQYDWADWKLVTEITYWSSADIAAAEARMREPGESRPNYTIDSYGELTGLLSGTAATT